MKILFLFILTFLAGCGSWIGQNKKTNRVDKLINSADAYVGMNENTNRSKLRSFIDLDPVNYEWCAAFVNAALKTVNLPGSEAFNDNPLLAKSFLNWGEEVKSPRRGDIVVFSRGTEGWQGHAGFYITSYTDGETEYYIILGGNQNDEVSYSEFNVKKAISIRRWP